MWEYKNELYHHGVKGQKWGVRRNLEEKYGRRGERTPEQKARVKKTATIAFGTAAVIGAAAFAASPYGRKKISQVVSDAKISAGRKRAIKALNSGKYTSRMYLDNSLINAPNTAKISYRDPKTGVTAIKEYSNLPGTDYRTEYGYISIPSDLAIKSKARFMGRPVYETFEPDIKT